MLLSPVVLHHQPTGHRGVWGVSSETHVSLGSDSFPFPLFLGGVKTNPSKLGIWQQGCPEGGKSLVYLGGFKLGCSPEQTPAH